MTSYEIANLSWWVVSTAAAGVVIFFMAALINAVIVKTRQAWRRSCVPYRFASRSSLAHSRGSSIGGSASPSHSTAPSGGASSNAFGA